MFLYVAETWLLKKTKEKKLGVAKMRMLRWMCGVTRVNSIRNDRIRGTVQLVEAWPKAQRRLQWFSRVKRRIGRGGYVGMRVIKMNVQGGKTWTRKI